jgi:hypothetical protein
MNRKPAATKYAEISTAALQAWLNNHVNAIAVGINIGQLDRDKAQAFRLELIRRSL